MLTTWCVGDAWYQFYIKKQDIVTRVFRKVGLSLPIDGSADRELDIRGLTEVDIGDWRFQTDDPLELDLADVNMKNSDSIGYVVDSGW